MSVFLALAATALLLALAGPVFRSVLFTLRCRRLMRHMPGPPTNPIFGNFLAIAGPHELVLPKVARLVERYPAGFKFWVSIMYPVLMLLNPDDLEVVLTSPHLTQKFSYPYSALLPIIGNGLITINGPSYRRHRKAITTSLHLDILQEFVVTFSENGKRLVRRLEERAESGVVFDATPLFGCCATNTVCETIMSTDVADMETEWDAFVDVAHKSSSLMLMRALRPWFWFLPDALLPNSGQIKEYRELAAGMTSFVSKVLDRKLEQVRSGNIPKRRRQAFLDHVLRTEEGSVLSKEELFDELKTLLFAGSSTSMDFLSLFAVSMSLLPEVQENVQKELDEIFGDDDERPVQFSDLPHMQYLERVIREVLRYFPPVSGFARQASADVMLPSGFVVPKDTAVAIVPYFVHRNPEWFPNPQQFDPDRFLPENCRGRHPFAFIPFSAGSRNCIGQRYGLLFAKTIAASVLRRFSLLPDPEGPKSLADVPLFPGISLAVQGGARVRVERRARLLDFPEKSRDPVPLVFSDLTLRPSPVVGRS